MNKNRVTQTPATWVSLAAGNAVTSQHRRLPLATFEQIRRRAFEICRKRGSTEAPVLLDWFKADAN